MADEDDGKISSLEDDGKISLETWLLVGFAAAILMSTILIVVVSAGKNPARLFRRYLC